MSTVRIYKSTDPGAPPHPSSTRGSMAALLRACLVTGWTSGDFTAAPAGWEEPFAETNGYACFRAIQGVARQFYQIDDATTNANVTRLTSYDSMSDAQSGAGARGQVYFGKWYTSSQFSSYWKIIADEKTCYVALQSQGAYILHGFGEYLSLVDSDPCPAFISGHADSTNLASADTNIPLSQARTISDATTQAGYVRSSISSQEISSFSVINVGVDSGEGISRYGQFTSSPAVSVSFLHLPLMIKSCADAAAGVRQPCGFLRGARQILSFPGGWSGSIQAGATTLEYINVDAGTSTGIVAFDITGSWD